MRIALTSDLISRDGTVDQDAKMLNAYADGEEAVKRPAASTALATASGTAQGGIANNSLAYMINGDSLRSYNSAGTLQATIAL